MEHRGPTRFVGLGSVREQGRLPLHAPEVSRLTLAYGACRPDVSVPSRVRHPASARVPELRQPTVFAVGLGGCPRAVGAVAGHPAVATAPGPPRGRRGTRRPHPAGDNVAVHHQCHGAVFHSAQPARQHAATREGGRRVHHKPDEVGVVGQIQGLLSMGTGNAPLFRDGKESAKSWGE